MNEWKDEVLVDEIIVKEPRKYSLATRCLVLLTAVMITIMTAFTGFSTVYAYTGDVTAAVEKAADSVVEITTESKKVHPIAGQYVTEGAGSGVILSSDGYIVTNYHVVEGASQIKVILNNGVSYDATVIGSDQQSDLAVLKIDAAGLTPATFADSDAIRVGQVAVAIGNPMGELGGTVTSGIISAMGREITIDGQAMTLLQTSAAVNPGNSGGGLFDSSGNLVGVVNAKSYGTDIEGLGFAIPSNTVQKVVTDLMETGYVTGRPQLGIGVLEVNDRRSAMYYQVSELGVYIASTAQANGLMKGDQIISIDGQEIGSTGDISKILNRSQVGDVLSVVVVREGKEVTVPVTLSEQQPEVL